MSIRTKPATNSYRRHWDAIFDPQRPPEPLSLINAPVEEIFYAHLVPLGGPGGDWRMYKRECPKCEGVLPLQRDDEGELMRVDRCTLCGQRYKYIDGEWPPIPRNPLEEDECTQED